MKTLPLHILLYWAMLLVLPIIIPIDTINSKWQSARNSLIIISFVISWIAFLVVMILILMATIPGKKSKEALLDEVSNSMHGQE